MRNSVEKWLQSIWYSEDTPPWYLRMLEPLYRAGYKFDQRQSKTRKPRSGGEPANPGNTANTSEGAVGRNHTTSASSANSSEEVAGRDYTASAKLVSSRNTPLLVVGNITVGGSGKTPLVIALCKMAREFGVKSGVASTGYGRNNSETLHVRADSETSDCGDEPVLIALRTQAPVIVANRRQDAIAELNKLNLDLIISDDGLQTPGLQRDIEICVVDGARGIGNGHLLPAGPLREPVERLQQVDRVVSNGEWLSKPAGMNISKMDLIGDSFCSLDGAQKLSASEFFGACSTDGIDSEVHRIESNVYLFAAIGNPDRFFNSIRQLEQTVSPDCKKVDSWHEHRFADHHTYQAADFDKVPKGATIVMTEKDAVKCRKLKLENAWCLPVEAELDAGFIQWFGQLLNKLKQD